MVGATRFYKDDIELSIGAEGENDYLLDGTRLGNYDYDYDVDYLKDGMACHFLDITKTKQFWFGICWIHNLSKDEENYDTQTWFGSVPTFMHKAVRWSILDGKLNYD